MQLVAAFIYSMVSAAIFNFAMGFRDACTEDAAFRFACPNQRTFFTASVFWGTISPNRLFGKGRRYNLMLLGFPLGVSLVLGEFGSKSVANFWASTLGVAQEVAT